MWWWTSLRGISSVLFWMCLLWRLSASQYLDNEILTEANSTCKSDLYTWPTCMDLPGGYKCDCGSGLYWNTHICISEAVDSEIQFPPPITREEEGRKREEYSYTVLLAKSFPELNEFTISLWVKPAGSKMGLAGESQDEVKLKKGQEIHTLLSYSHGLGEPYLSVYSLPTLALWLHNTTLDTGKELPVGYWTHVGVVRDKTGVVNLYINGTKESRTAESEVNLLKSPLPGGGLLVLGQDSPTSEPQAGRSPFPLEKAFVGGLSLVNIWTHAMSEKDIVRAGEDCTLTHCGTAVDWVDFRVGTRGAAELSWSSGIFNECYSAPEAGRTCDRYCAHQFSVRCKQEVVESVLWDRVPTGTTLVVTCPNSSPNHTANASRTCNEEDVEGDVEGVWSEPNVRACADSKLYAIMSEIKEYAKRGQFKLSYSRTYLSQLEEHVKEAHITSPIDISIVLHCLGHLLSIQEHFLELNSLHKVSHPKSDHTSEPASSKELCVLAQRMSDVLEALLSGTGREGAWSLAIPLGEMADRFLQTAANMGKLVGWRLLQDLHNGTISLAEASCRLSTSSIDVLVTLTNRYYGIDFHLKHADPASAADQNLAKDPPLVISSGAEGDDSLVCVVGEFLLKDYFTTNLPNNTQNNIINAPVFYNQVYRSEGSREAGQSLMVPVDIFSDHAAISFSLYKDDNTSNPRCGLLSHFNSSSGLEWSLLKDKCTLESNTKCLCSEPGFYVLTTDMYNVNWRKKELPRVLITSLSYVSVSICGFLILLTLGLLVYVGASTGTAQIHKHFAVAIVSSFVVFVIGVPLINGNTVVCRGFAVLFHYLFLSTFCWLTNDALNLYICITYSAHSAANDQQTSSHWRYYIIMGWAMPAVMVSAVVAVKADVYFSPDMCLANLNLIWVIIGPPVGFLTITLLVLIFASKENYENAYTRNEAANKMTQNHSRGVWSQLVLLTASWAFAFITIQLQSNAFNWIFFIFNTTQGAFFFVFNFLLTEEVHSVFKGKSIKQQLAWDVVSSELGTLPQTSNNYGNNSTRTNNDRTTTHHATSSASATGERSTNMDDEPLLSETPLHHDSAKCGIKMREQIVSNRKEARISLADAEDIESLTETTV